MKKLQILRVDNDLVQKVDLQIGNNIISRKVVTACDNDQVIKHAAIINVMSNNEMTITPVSPCYMKSTESSRWQLLKLGVTVPIKPGDVCTLVPEKCWFKIILVSDKMENNEDYALKRKANEDIDSDTIHDKRLCSESGEGDNLQYNVLNKMLNKNNDITKVKVEENIINENNVSYNDNEDKTQNSNSILKYECQNIHHSSVTEDISKIQNANKSNDKPANEKNLSLKNSHLTSINVNNEKVTTKNIQSPISKGEHESKISTNVTVCNVFRRNKCKYGKECYRKNSQHRDKFSHPDDPDYDIPDNRKKCPYGTQCYRKNPQHKIQFKHTDKDIASKHNKRNYKQTQKQSLDILSGIEDSSAEESAEESVDESEYEPSDIESSDDDEIYSDKNESEQENIYMSS
ncbi:aprataxin and PNK-like factor isoform X2 [Apis cerana]|uniref:aprataxin and PNK-like factor isoform X2 n=2 Tax=Apis cerana TaxID=7461 RepID=UPI0007E2ACD6|nr:aprataxin and PNK-like factor isoform X2 [Apis cerana]